MIYARATVPHPLFILNVKNHTLSGTAFMTAAGLRFQYELVKIA